MRKMRRTKRMMSLALILAMLLTMTADHDCLRR